MGMCKTLISSVTEFNTVLEKHHNFFAFFLDNLKPKFLKRNLISE